MGTNEEYLDKLLQSVTQEEKSVEHDVHEHNQNMTDDELLASLVDMYKEELADFVEEEIIHKEQTKEVSNDVIEDTSEEAPIAEQTIENILNSKIDEFEEDDVTSTEEYTTIDNEQLSQDDIENLLNSLQDDLSSETTDLVDADKLIEDFSEEKDSVLQELLTEPQVLDEEDAELLLRDKEDDFESVSEENIMPEMGIEGMSEEQINDLLNAAAENEKAENSAETSESGELGLDALFGGLSFADDFDPEHKASEEMADLLGGMLGGNDDLSEINNLLSKADDFDSADDSNLRNLLENEEEIGGNDLLNELLQADVEKNEEETTTDKKKVKKEKVKKEKVKKEKAPKKPKEKKEGENFWKKLTSIMFEEEEEIDDDKKVKIGDGDELAALMDKDENDAVFAGLMSSDKKKDKKKSKNKKGKAEKNKQENENAEEGEETIDPKEKAKQEKLKAKAEKKAAKKKAKEDKAEADRVFLKAQPSISTKRAMVAVSFALSIMVIILVIYNFVPASIEKANARKAFYNKDYYECYELLQGKELNDSDKILLNKVICILKMQRKLDAYNNYVKMDKYLEAINLLIEAVELYEKSHTYAKALSIDKEYDAIYDEILLILNGRYGVSEEIAKEINAYESDAQYTISLQNIIEGKSFDSNEEGKDEKPMEDILPEEKDFLEGQ